MSFAKVNEVLIGIFNVNIYIKGIPNIHHEPKNIPPCFWMDIYSTKYKFKS